MAKQEIVFQQTLEFLGKNNKTKRGKSDKFYEIVITLDEPKSDWPRYIETRRWGKYGAKGQIKVLEHWYSDDAIISAKKKLRKQREKGYTDPINALTRLATVAE